MRRENFLFINRQVELLTDKESSGATPRQTFFYMRENLDLYQDNSHQKKIYIIFCWSETIRRIS